MTGKWRQAHPSRVMIVTRKTATWATTATSKAVTHQKATGKWPDTAGMLQISG